MFFTICSHLFFQKVRSTAFSTIVYSIFLLFTVGFRCNSKNIPEPEVVELPSKVAGSPHNTSRCFHIMSTSHLINQTSKSVQASQSSLESSIVDLLIRSVSKRDETLEKSLNEVTYNQFVKNIALTKISTPLKTTQRPRQMSLWEELNYVGGDLDFLKKGNKSSFEGEPIVEVPCLLLDTLKSNIILFEEKQENVMSDVMSEMQKIATLNDKIIDNIRLNSTNVISLLVSQTLKTIQTLQQELNSYLDCSKSHDVEKEIKEVKEILQPLIKAVKKQHEEFLSKKQSLEHDYNNMYVNMDQTNILLHSNIRYLTNFFTNNTQLKEVQEAIKIINRLNQLADEQLNVLHVYKNKTTKIKETIIETFKEYTNINLKSKTTIENRDNYLEKLTTGKILGSSEQIKRLINSLQYVQNDIESIQKNLDSDKKTESLLEQKIKKVVTEIKEAENELKSEIEPKTKEITSQVEALKNVIRTLE